MPGPGVDLSGKESVKVGSLPARGRIALDYDMRDDAMWFELRGQYSTMPWHPGYAPPRFRLEDLKDLQLLLVELDLLAGKPKGLSFEQRLASGHYDNAMRRKTFLPDALSELGLSGDGRALSMLKVSLSETDGDMKRAWGLFKSMVKAAAIASQTTE